MPDQDKSFMPDGSGDADWHYLDGYSYDPLPYQGKYDGELPWAMKWILDNIVYYLKNEDWNTAAELMGAICHFTGDATMPLHSTWDYWIGGMHTEFESVASNHSNDSEMSIPTDYAPQYLDDVTNAALLTLKDSFDFTDEDPNGGTNLSDYLEVGTTWNDWIKSMTENRIRAAVRFTANVWYTAFVQAGLVSIETSSVDSITPYWQMSIPFTITATVNESVDSVSLYYRHSTDNSSWGAWTFFENDYSSPYSWSFTAPQSDGYYEFYSIAKKGDDVESAPVVADAGCGVDRVAPASSVDTISPYLQTSTSLQITVTASDVTSGVKEVSLYYRYSTDNSSWSAWTFYGTDTVAPWAWSVVAPSGNGYYEFYSIARDKATNAESAPTQADTMCRIGTDGPSAPAKSSPANGTTTHDNTPTFTWFAVTGSSVGIARYELWVDDNSDFSSPKILENTADNVTTSYTPTTELANGNYSWRVRAWDQAGKSSPFEQAWTFTINTALTPAQRGVEVSIFPSSKSGALGESLIYTVTVTNTGDVTEDYDLSKIDTLGWSLTLQLSVAGIEPNEERQVTLTVVISPTAENNASDSITVTATSSEDNTIKDSASCTALCVASAKGVTFLTISPSRFALYPGYSGQVKELTATLRDSNYNLLANKAITWSATAGSVSPSSGTTNALGQVSVVYTSPTVTAETPQVTITASFAGDAQYQASSGTSLGIIATPTTVNISSDGGTVIINVIEIDVTMTILEVPQNALSENTAITVVQKPIAAPAGYAGLSNIFDIGPSGATFAIPSTLTLPYDESELPIGVSEGDLAIYHRTSGGGWERVGGSVNTTANTVSVQIDHLSEYAVMASIPPPPPSEGGLPLLTIGVIIAVILIITIITILIRRR